MGVHLDEQLIQLSEANHHLIVRADVAKVMTSRQWCRRLDNGVWLPVAPGVWRHRVTRVDWRLQARAGVRSLGKYSALYGRTAAAWWDLGKIQVDDVEFLVPRSRRPRPFPFVIHTSTRWTKGDVLLHEGVRVTSATRTVVDLAAGRTSAEEIEQVIDAAVQRRLTSVLTLNRRSQALGGRGVPGSQRLGALLLDSGGDSFLERKFLMLVRKAGLPRPLCQVVHRSGSKRIARVDFQFAETNVVVEVSGRLGHVSDSDRKRDAVRRNALQQTGQIVLEFTTAHVLDEQRYVIDTLNTHLPRPAQ